MLFSLPFLLVSAWFPSRLAASATPSARAGGVRVMRPVRKVKDLVPLPPGTMRLEAAYVEFDHESQRIVLRGSAFLEYEDMKLWADVIDGSLRDGKVEAYGQVRFWRPGERLYGTMVSYNYRLRTGRMENLFTRRGADYIRAARLTIRGDVLEGEEVTATSCDEREPHYLLKAARMRMRTGKRLDLYDVDVFLFGRRVFSMGHYGVDLREGNTTGRGLFVSPGYSASKGFYVRSNYGFYFSPKYRGKLYYNPSQKGISRRGAEVKIQPDGDTDVDVSCSRYTNDTIGQSEDRWRVRAGGDGAFGSASAKVDLDVISTANAYSDRPAEDEELNVKFSVEDELDDWRVRLDYSRRFDTDGSAYSYDDRISSLDASPRFSFSKRTPLLATQGGFKLDFEGSFARLRERVGGGATVVDTDRKEMVFTLSAPPLSPFPGSRWNWSVRFNGDFYGTGDERFVLNLSMVTSDRISPLLSSSFVYSYQSVGGDSPFAAYDTLSDTNRLTWYLRSSGSRVRATILQYTHDLASGDGVSASSNFQFQHRYDGDERWILTLGGVYDLGAGKSLSCLSLGSLSLNFMVERLSVWRHNLIVNYDHHRGRISSTSGTFDFLLARTIRMRLAANYSRPGVSSALERSRLDLALTKDLHCMEARLLWDVEREEAMLEFYLKSESSRRLTIGVDYRDALEIRPRFGDDLEGTIWGGW